MLILLLCFPSITCLQAIQAQNAAKEQQQQKVSKLEAAKRDAGVCATCGVSLYGKLALDIYDRRCCTSECVIKLRRQLAADAAMKRFQNSG